MATGRGMPSERARWRNLAVEVIGAEVDGRVLLSRPDDIDRRVSVG